MRGAFYKTSVSHHIRVMSEILLLSSLLLFYICVDKSLQLHCGCIAEKMYVFSVSPHAPCLYSHSYRLRDAS